MKRNVCYFLLAALTGMVLSACDGDDPAPLRVFDSGVIVVNEGKFTAGNGSVSHYDPETEEVTLDVARLGDVVQSALSVDDLVYFVVNNEGKVKAVDAETFALNSTIADLSIPRYMAVAAGKGFITEWVSYIDIGRVSVVDLALGSVSNTIETDKGSEGIILVNGKLYVSNNFSNTVSVIDPQTEEVVETIDVGLAPAEMVVDADGNLWVICSGTFGGNDGSLVQIDPETDDVLDVFDLDFNPSGRLAINGDRDQLYFLNGTAVYHMSTSATEAPAAPLITEADAIVFYGIGVDPATDRIYAADARDFESNGTVFVYESDGTPVGEFTSGVSPNMFLFRN